MKYPLEGSQAPHWVAESENPSFDISIFNNTNTFSNNPLSTFTTQFPDMQLTTSTSLPSCHSFSSRLNELAGDEVSYDPEPNSPTEAQPEGIEGQPESERVHSPDIIQQIASEDEWQTNMNTRTKYINSINKLLRILYKLYVHVDGLTKWKLNDFSIIDLTNIKLVWHYILGFHINLLSADYQHWIKCVIV